MPEHTSGQTLRLRDGRNLGLAVYGDPDGKPRFYPGEGHLLAEDRMEETQAALFS